MGDQEGEGMTLTVNHAEAGRFVALKKQRNGLKSETIEKYHRLYEIHNKHPEYTKKDLAMVTGFSHPMIRQYWKRFVKYPVQMIRGWNEVMA